MLVRLVVLSLLLIILSQWTQIFFMIEERYQSMPSPFPAIIETLGGDRATL